MRRTVAETGTVRWSSYAADYDLLAEHNPHYQALLHRVRSWVAQAALRPGATFIDLGGGTGNVALCLAQARPDCQVVLMDTDGESLRRAREKCDALGVRNLDLHQRDMSDLAWLGGGSAEPRLFLCIHALYLAGAPGETDKPRQILQAVRAAMRPGDWLLIFDIGRPIPLLRWGVAMAWQVVRREGIAALHRGWRATRHARAANRAIVHMQRRGQCLTHDLAGFLALLQRSGLPPEWIVEASEAWFGGIDSSVLLHRPPVGKGRGSDSSRRVEFSPPDATGGRMASAR